MSKDFHKAFELRQVSDYKNFTPISREKARAMLDSAKRFVEAVKKYLSPS
jgi:uncharacterized protein (UPF0332 family)